MKVFILSSKSIGEIKLSLEEGGLSGRRTLLDDLISADENFF